MVILGHALKPRWLFGLTFNHFSFLELGRFLTGNKFHYQVWSTPEGPPFAFGCLLLCSRFLESNLTVLESTSTHFIGLNRSGSSGNVSAYLTVLNGSTAIQGVQLTTRVSTPKTCGFTSAHITEGLKGRFPFELSVASWQACPTKPVRGCTYCRG